MKFNSPFWRTPEVMSWANGLNYEGYVAQKKGASDLSKPLSEEAYKAFCNVLDDEMDRDFGVVQS